MHRGCLITASRRWVKQPVACVSSLVGYIFVFELGITALLLRCITRTRSAQLFNTVKKVCSLIESNIIRRVKDPDA